MPKIFNKAYDPAFDPYASTVDDIANYYHIQSVTKGGTFLDLIAPSSANFPDALAGTPARYFLYLPMRIDRSDLSGSRPIVLKDETSATTLTRVTGTPSANEYRIPPENSIRRNAIELHSGQAGHTISYDYYGEASMFSSKEWNKKRWVNNYTTSISYAILDDDLYDRIDIPHTSTTAKVIITLPTLADNLGRRIRVQNTGTGLTVVDGEGSEKLSFLGNSLDDVKLLMEDDYIEIVAEATDWKVEHCYISMITRWINRSDWTNVHIGSAFSYDNGSGTSTKNRDWTGDHITEATSNQTGVVIYDSGGAGASGILYVYNVSGSTGIWTNNRVITSGYDGQTIDVNEATGSSKNIDYNIYHGLGIDYNLINISPIISATAAFTNAQKFDYAFGTTDSMVSFWQVDTNYVKIQSGNTGFGSFVDDSGNITGMTTQDYYVNLKLEISF